MDADGQRRRLRDRRRRGDVQLFGRRRVLERRLGVVAVGHRLARGHGANGRLAWPDAKRRLDRLGLRPKAATQSYGYSTDSTYTSTTGHWTTTGSVWAGATGATNSSFSGNSPFSTSTGNEDDGASLSGTVSGSGSDWSTYSYTKTENVANGLWSGSGGATGGSSETWGYSGTSGSFWQTGDGGTAGGTASGVSGSETYSTGYSSTASMSPGEGWTQTGTGSASDSFSFGYSYSGSGSGTVPTDENGYPISWNLSNEHGSGGGSGSYNDPFSFGLTAGTTFSDSPTYNANTTQEDAYNYQTNYTNAADVPDSASTTITDDGIVNTNTTGWGLAQATTTTFSGSGTGTTTNSGSSTTDPDDWWNYVTTGTWSPSSDGSQVDVTIANDNTNGADSPFPYQIPGSDSDTWGPYSFIPSLWSSYTYEFEGGLFGFTGFAGPGPAPMSEPSSQMPAPIGMGYNGVDFPGDSDAWANETPADGVSYLYTSPTLPCSLGTLPALANIQTVSWPAAASSVWGMNFTAAAGYGSGATAPQTQFASGNNPSSLPAFTSETIVGGPFGRNSLFPATWSWIVVGYGFRGVSAVPALDLDSLIVASDSLTAVVEPVCFPADALIEMADGAIKRAERIEEDDDVKAVDQNNPEGPVSVGKVIKVYRHGPQKLIEVEVGGHAIRCTPKHPFYVRGRGFTAAAELKSGDELRTSDGGWTAVGSVSDNGEVEPVFNFQVAGLHTYFVRNSNGVAVLVHNDSGASDGAANARTQALSAEADVQQMQALLDYQPSPEAYRAVMGDSQGPLTLDQLRRAKKYDMNLREQRSMEAMKENEKQAFEMRLRAIQSSYNTPEREQKDAFGPFRRASPRTEDEAIVENWLELQKRAENGDWAAWRMLWFGPGGVGETGAVTASGFSGGFSVPEANIQLRDARGRPISPPLNIPGSVQPEGRPIQEHHFATNKSKTYTPDMKEIADSYDLKLNDEWNKEIMEHEGRHPDEYHDFVLDGMREAQREAGANKEEFLRLYEKYVKEPVRNNPDLLRKSGWRR